MQTSHRHCQDVVCVHVNAGNLAFSQFSFSGCCTQSSPTKSNPVSIYTILSPIYSAVKLQSNIITKIPSHPKCITTLPCEIE